MRFSLKIIIGYAIVCLLTVAMASLFFLTFERYQRSSHMIFLIEQVRGREQELQLALHTELQSIRELLRNPNLVQAQRVQENTKKVRSLIDELRGMEERLSSQLEELDFPLREFPYLDRFQVELETFDSAFGEIHSALIAGPKPDDADAAGMADRFEVKLQKWTMEMNGTWHRDMGRAIAHIQLEKRRTTYILLGMVTVNIVLSLLLSVVLVTSVRRVMGRLAAGMRRVSSGDYDHPVQPCGDPEMNYLVQRFNRMAGELKRLEEMRRDFISMLTHDMKSPLTVIKMYAGMILERDSGDPRPAETISRNADRMLHLVENFLDFSKSESASLQPDLHPISLHRLVSRVLEDCDVLARSRRVRLTSSLDDTLPRVMADEGKMERVLHNLVTNGIKYNNEGGTVAVHARLHGNLVRVTVEDTGIGISESDRGRLFVKYSRAERTRHIQGTGLGLVVSREIVRAHGSDLVVVSREGEGTAFSFDLRIAGGPEPASSGDGTAEELPPPHTPPSGQAFS